MFIDNKTAYQVLERCNDLFPDWKKENNQYWNSKTGEIITKSGVAMNDLVYRDAVKEVKDWADNHDEQQYLFPIEELEGTKVIPYVYDGKELNIIFGSKY